MRLWTALTKARNRQHDQARIDRFQRVVAESEAGHHIRTVVLDNDIRLGNQVLDQIYRSRRAQVQTNVALTRILLVVITRQPRDIAAPQASHIAIWWLDLHDIGPQITEHATGKGPRQHSGKIQHLQTVQRIVFIGLLCSQCPIPQRLPSPYALMTSAEFGRADDKKNSETEQPSADGATAGRRQYGAIRLSA